MHRHLRDGMTPPDRVQTIAVIGAGLAGLVCAQQLQAGGHAVTVFDQAQIPGGRMRHYSAEQWQCDHGAQYFTARDPAFAAVVDAWIDAGIAAPWQARIASWDGTRLRRSQSALTRYVGVPEMPAPARTLAAQLDVRLCAEVHALRRGRQGWRVSVSQDAAEPLFDTVLLAVPAPNAAALVAQAAPAACMGGDGALRCANRSRLRRAVRQCRRVTLGGAQLQQARACGCGDLAAACNGRVEPGALRCHAWARHRQPRAGACGARFADTAVLRCFFLESRQQRPRVADRLRLGRAAWHGYVWRLVGRRQGGGGMAEWNGVGPACVCRRRAAQRLRLTLCQAAQNRG
ncbi:hypothetical protein MOU_02287 [Xanthomonas citri pv. malvacearum str. GSPB1386]|nr:hypothetical protein MOU_02287 [Xanthomonas citri pv. malvacearum str. GSPB1386]